MIKKTVLLILFFASAFTSTCFAETKVMPLFNAFLGFGNAFYEEQSGTPSISYDVDYVPAMIFSDKLTLLPRFNSNYTGTMLPKKIEEEGNIYVQTWDNLLFAKLVDKINSNWTLRGELGLKSELARETADESWGKGLYDYNTNHIELSAEKKFERPMSLTFGERIFSTIFPNYESLAAGTTQYAQLAGKNVLDTGNSETFVKFEWLLNKTFLKCQLSATQSNYSDQKIVSAIDGHYLSDKRKDGYSDFTVGISQLLPDFKTSSDEDSGKRFRTFLGVNFRSLAKDSNQNQFDTEKIVGQKDFYDYRQTAISPSITLRFLPSNSDLSLTYDIIQKRYDKRLVQDVNGNYSKTEEMIYQNSTILNLKYAFPVFKNRYQAYVSGSFRTAKSNMLYEKYFQYNFSAYTYMLGISYEY